MTQTAGGKSAPSSIGVTRAAAPVWRVQLLGGLRVVPLQPGSEGEAFGRFRTHKTALLLARLLLYPNRSHSRDELVDWLWPDAPIERGRANLSQTLLHLRKQFASGGASFVADHQSICVRAQDFQTDVVCFEQKVRDARAFARTTQNAPPQELAALWEAALQEWEGGELLPGFYDDWVENERSRLNELRQNVQTSWQATSAQAAAQPAALLPALPSQTSPPLVPSPSPLPLTLTRFFGRDADTARVCDLLTQNPPVRLVTLVGMGGIGKTRLAVEAARQLTANGTFGFAAFMPLADLADAAHVPAALVRFLGLSLSAGEESDPVLAVVRFLSEMPQKANGRVLLLLDNLEQFGGTCAPLVARLLTQVPALCILATSRQPVGVVGEQEVIVGPLAGSTAEGDAARRPDALLFVDRARLVRPDFAVTPRNAASVENLCGLLEGVPLAIELAAAWSRTISPAQIAARLNHRFDLLALRGVFGGDIPKRHQSLHAAIAWSYDLLSPSLQVFFAQLSVFRGGWTIEAAQAVTGVKDATEPLFLLAERSLILAEPDAAEGTGPAAETMRYRMLESLREFGHEQAGAMGRAFCNALLLRHAHYFDTLSREADGLAGQRGVRPALMLLGAERDNLRAAFDYTFALADGPVKEPVLEKYAVGVRLATQSHWLWGGREAQDYLQKAAFVVALLPPETSLSLRASLLSVQGHVTMYRGELDDAERQLQESLALWQALGNEKEAAIANNKLGSLAWRQGDFPKALAAWETSLDLAQKTNNLRLESAMLNNLAVVGPDLAQRRAWIERAVWLDRTHAPGSLFLACSLNSMGDIAIKQSDWETARACLEEAHEVAANDGATGMIAVSKISLAEFLLAVHESLDRAETLLHEAQLLFETSEELPRIAETFFVRFQVALKRGDGNAALHHARTYFGITSGSDKGGAAVVLPPAYTAAVPDMVRLLREAGFAEQAAQLENRPV